MAERRRRSRVMTGLLHSIPSSMKIREELERMVVRDLLGPVGGREEEIDEPSVRDRYLVGMLAPKRQELSPEEFDELPRGAAPRPRTGRSRRPRRPTKTMFPSSFGLTFCVGLETEALRLTARWGHYHRDRSESLATQRRREEGRLEAVAPGGHLRSDPADGREAGMDPPMPSSRRSRSRGSSAETGPLLERHPVPGQRAGRAQEASGQGLAVPARIDRRVPRPKGRSSAATPTRRTPARPTRSRTPRSKKWRCSIAIGSSSASAMA